MAHWRHWKLLPELTAAKHRVLALNYRTMAATASTEGVVLALRKLAERHAAMAERREEASVTPAQFS